MIRIYELCVLKSQSNSFSLGLFMFGSAYFAVSNKKHC